VHARLAIRKGDGEGYAPKSVPWGSAEILFGEDFLLPREAIAAAHM
jgi:hypothetical protein